MRKTINVMTIGELKSLIARQRETICDYALAIRVLSSHCRDTNGNLPPMAFSDLQFLQTQIARAEHEKGR